MIPLAVRRLASLFGRLPGVGEKTGLRYALHFVSAGHDSSGAIAESLATLHDLVGPCHRCGSLAERTPEMQPDAPLVCSICTDHKRDASLLCVVAKMHDVFAIERAGTMRGRYFVLGHLLSPLDGVGPDELPLGKLSARIQEEGVREVILATPPSVDGEATALLIRRELETVRVHGESVSVTRIASGLPHGGELEFADPITMGRALSGRQKI